MKVLEYGMGSKHLKRPNYVYPTLILPTIVCKGWLSLHLDMLPCTTVIGKCNSIVELAIWEKEKSPICNNPWKLEPKTKGLWIGKEIVQFTSNYMEQFESSWHYMGSPTRSDTYIPSNNSCPSF
jgi:hypothetical protein